MSHVRTQIRHAVKALLDGATKAQGRVYPSRKPPLRKIDLPTICIYTLDEAVDPNSATSAPRELDRNLSLVIEGWVTAADDEFFDDAMDDLALEIENALHADPSFGGLAFDSILETTDCELSEGGDRMMGLVFLTYAVRYCTLAPEAPSDLDDFEGADTTYNLGNEVHEDDDAHDAIDVEAA